MLFLFSITWGSFSGWWALPCLLAGVLYAWLMYRQPNELSNTFRYLLAVIRAVAVAFVTLLLLSPLVRSVNYTPQKPLVLIAQDNSLSVASSNKVSSTGEKAPPKPSPEGRASEVKVSPTGGDIGADGLSQLKKQLGEQYDVREFNFDNELHTGLSKTFDGEQTNISAALHQLNERFVNQNIGAVVLATDGIYNVGADPQYEARNFKANIYTIALGDTIAKRDLLIANVNYNKTVLLGDNLEVEVLTEAYQANGEQIHLTVTEDGRQVSTQNIAVAGVSWQKVIRLKLNADKKGLRKFNISIAPVKNELSVQNNTETIYVDVLDARQKVLLVYNNTHPDIGVIKQGIEINKNYEVKTCTVTDLPTIKAADQSLLILYQVDASSSGTLKNIIERTKIPVWYMLGAQTDIQGFDEEQKTVSISAGRQEMQEVFVGSANNFSGFVLTDSTRQKLAHLPPLLAPFGTYTVSATSSSLLRQRIGEVATTYPLLSFSQDNGRRTAVLTGEGLWRWQLAEYQTYGNHNAVEELLGQSVQYLTANANHQQFRVYTNKNVFDEGENILLNAELYNDALQLVNTPDVRVELKNTAGKSYSFLFSRSGQSYQLNAGTLPVGEYTYTANTKIGDRTFNATGQLTIKHLNLEDMRSAADHQLLNTIAKPSGGVMLLPAQIGKLADLIRKNENIKTVVYEDKRYTDLVDVKWVFALIVVLLSTEWFLRKREGEV